MEYIFVLFILCLIIGLYGYWTIDTIRRLFHNTTNRRPKVFFLFVVFFLPILLVTAGTIFFVAPTSIEFPPCTKYHQQLETFWYVTWQNEIQITLFIVLASPLLFAVASLILRYRAEENNKIIYKRAKYILTLLIICILLISILFGSMNTARDSGIDSRRRASISQLRAVNEIYYDKFGSYPIVTGSNAAERWDAFKNKLSGIYTLPDDPCYTKTKDPYFQYDYRSSEDGTNFIAIALLQNPTSDDSGNLYSVYCVDNTGASKSIKLIPPLNQFICSP